MAVLDFMRHVSCVAGHPLRSFPLVERLLPGDSFGLLSMASKLRQNGEIPAGKYFDKYT